MSVISASLGHVEFICICERLYTFTGKTACRHGVSESMGDGSRVFSGLHRRVDRSGSLRTTVQQGDTVNPMFICKCTQTPEDCRQPRTNAVSTTCGRCNSSSSAPILVPIKSKLVSTANYPLTTPPPQSTSTTKLTTSHLPPAPPSNTAPALPSTAALAVEDPFHFSFSSPSR